MGGFDLDELRVMLKRDFAPWIQMLDMQPLSGTPDGMKFKMPENEELARQPDIICGQAIASFADTICVLTLFAHNDEPRLLTTVDMNVQFMRPLKTGAVFARTVIQSNGRRMANVRVEFAADESFSKLAASAVCVFAYI